MWAVGETYRIKYGKKLLLETRSASIDIFMLMFFFLLAFRGLQCGNDTRQYFNLFNKYTEYSFYQLFSNYNNEIGYKLLNKLIGATTNSYQLLLALTSFLCVYPVWWFYRRESTNHILTIVLFLSVFPYMMFFSGIRQAMAIALGVPAWYAAKSKKLFRFIFIVLFAMLFHTSAFMLAAIYPLYYAKITKKWLWFVVPCMVIVFFLRTIIFNFLITLLWQEYDHTSPTGAINILILLVLFGLYAYILPDEKSLDQDTVAMRNILLLSIVIQIFAMLHPLSMRMNYYFLLFVPLLIPKIARHSKKQFSQVSKLSVVVMTVYFAYYFVNTVITDNDPLNIFPYIPFWENG